MVNGLVPPYLSAIVPCNFQNVHDYNTRQAVSIPQYVLEQPYFDRLWGQVIQKSKRSTVKFIGISIDSIYRFFESLNLWQ
jgi:hypothetical protein